MRLANLLLIYVFIGNFLHAEDFCSQPVKSGKAVVFDAGSSGTRVFIYDWQIGANKNEIPVIKLPENRTKKVSPGLATFGNNIEKIAAYLAPLIDFAKEVVGKSEIEKTPLFFAGTAGLRLEQKRDPASYQRIIDKTKDLLTKSGFKLAFGPGFISGQEEGAFAWLNVNSLLNKLPDIINGKDLGIGIVEMGGASFQLAFLPKNPPIKEAFSINLAGKNLVLYSHSYGDLGENEARSKFSNKEFCEWGNDNKGDFDKCRKTIINNIINIKGKECEQCGLGDIFQPKLSEVAKEFYALGALGYLPLNFNIETVNANNLRKKGLEICNVAFKDAVLTMPALKNNTDMMKKQCFNLAYYSAVLTGNEKYEENGLGFPGDTTMLIAKNSINNQEISWTYGLLMLNIEKFVTEEIKARCGR